MYFLDLYRVQPNMPRGGNVPVGPRDSGPKKDNPGRTGGGNGGSIKPAVYHPPPQNFPKTTNC